MELIVYGDIPTAFLELVNVSDLDYDTKMLVGWNSKSNIEYPKMVNHEQINKLKNNLIKMGVFSEIGCVEENAIIFFKKGKMLNKIVKICWHDYGQIEKI